MCGTYCQGESLDQVVPGLGNHHGRRRVHRLDLHGNRRHRDHHYKNDLKSKKINFEKMTKIQNSFFSHKIN